MSSPLPLAASSYNTAVVRQDLRIAIKRSSERCLFQSAKWLAELLNGLPSDDAPELEMSNSQQDASTQSHPSYATSPQEAQLEALDDDKFVLAKTFFDCHEYDRAFNAAVGCKSSKGRFLSLYSKFMAGEKRKEEESEMVLGPMDGTPTPNRELVYLVQMLEKLVTQEKCNDSFLLYLYGIVLSKQKNEPLAQKMFVHAIIEYPYNWGAWHELKDTLHSYEDLNNILPVLPEHLIGRFFLLNTNQELYQFTTAVHEEVTQLQTIFPGSLFLKTQRALLYYHARAFEDAEAAFDDVVKEDSYRLDSLDTYSNVLYVMGRIPKLAFLAQIATATDKFRPETCCIIGNYYSQKSDHEKAVLYFRRALNLDRTYLAAWTLMGHEYIELKNTHAAIEAYRRAIDANRKDYRAWYGLGQTYEVLEMHYYALFYYQRAAALRPYDAQMWQAMAVCYDKMNRTSDAIKAYKRALIGIPSSSSSESVQSDARSFDTMILYSIALLYEKLNMHKETKMYMEMCLQQEDAGNPVTVGSSKARMWIAKFEKDRDRKRALQLATELVNDGVDLEEAKALIRDLRAREDAERLS